MGFTPILFSSQSSVWFSGSANGVDDCKYSKQDKYKENDTDPPSSSYLLVSSHFLARKLLLARSSIVLRAMISRLSAPYNIQQSWKITSTTFSSNDAQTGPGERNVWINGKIFAKKGLAWPTRKFIMKGDFEHSMCYEA